MQFQDKAKDLFTHHPDAQNLHFTADGFGFFEKSHAESHAQTLGDRAIESISRSDLGNGPDSGSQGKTAANYSKKNKAELLELISERGLEVSSGAKNADLVAALEADDAAKDAAE